MARAHIRLRARFRPVSPTSLCAIASGETDCRNGTKKKPLITLAYQKYTPFFSRGDLQMTKSLVSKMTESLYECRRVDMYAASLPPTSSTLYGYIKIYWTPPLDPPL